MVTPEPTPERTPEITPEPIDPTADNNRVWLDLILDDGYSGIGTDGPVHVPTPEPIVETPQPTEARPSTGPPTGDDGTLQVIEPPPSQGLLDAIVGDVVASFLGK